MLCPKILITLSYFDIVNKKKTVVKGGTTWIRQWHVGNTLIFASMQGFYFSRMYTQVKFSNTTQL